MTEHVENFCTGDENCRNPPGPAHHAVICPRFPIEEERRAVEKAYQRSFLLWLRGVLPEYFESTDRRKP